MNRHLFAFFLLLMHVSTFDKISRRTKCNFMWWLLCFLFVFPHPRINLNTVYLYHHYHHHGVIFVLYRIWLVLSDVLVQKVSFSTFTVTSVWMTMSAISLPVAQAHATTPLVAIAADVLMATNLTQHSPFAYR